MLRVAVGAVSNVDLPLNEVLGAFVQATGAELLDSMHKEAPGTMNSGSLPVFGERATVEEIQGFKDLRGAAYEYLCDFMRKVELSPLRCWSRCLPCHRPLTIVNWRDCIVQVKNRTGGCAWVLKTNKEAYLREHGGS